MRTLGLFTLRLYFVLVGTLYLLQGKANIYLSLYMLSSIHFIVVTLRSPTSDWACSRSTSGLHCAARMAWRRGMGAHYPLNQGTNHPRKQN